MSFKLGNFYVSRSTPLTEEALRRAQALSIKHDPDGIYFIDSKTFDYLAKQLIKKKKL